MKNLKLGLLCLTGLLASKIKSTPSRSLLNVENKTKKLSIDHRHNYFFDYGTRFKGEYLCPQGLTTLVFLIYSWPTQNEPEGSGIMIFMPHDRSDHECYGIYSVNIKMDDYGHVKMTPNEWLENPCDYKMVGFNGGIYDGGQKFNGKVMHDYCGSFDTSLWNP